MSPDERARIELTQRLADQFGDELAAYLMETLPPFSWHEVATKSDLRALESRVDERFDRMERQFDLKIDALDSKLGGRIDALDSKLGGRIDALDSKLGGRIDALDGTVGGRIDALDSKLGGHIDTLDGKVGGLESRLDERTNLLRAEARELQQETIAVIRGELVRNTRQMMYGTVAAMGVVAASIIAAVKL
jgi:hypothetical protein